MIVLKSGTPFYGEKISDLPANSGTYSYNAIFFFKFVKSSIMGIVVTLFLLRICLCYSHV